jgi:hypothetical protein
MRRPARTVAVTTPPRAEYESTSTVAAVARRSRAFGVGVLAFVRVLNNFWLLVLGPPVQKQCVLIIYSEDTVKKHINNLVYRFVLFMGI